MNQPTLSRSLALAALLAATAASAQTAQIHATVTGDSQYSTGSTVATAGSLATPGESLTLDLTADPSQLSQITVDVPGGDAGGGTGYGYSPFGFAPQNGPPTLLSFSVTVGGATYQPTPDMLASYDTSAMVSEVGQYLQNDPNLSYGDYYYEATLQAGSALAGHMTLDVYEYSGSASANDTRYLSYNGLPVAGAPFLLGSSYLTLTLVSPVDPVTSQAHVEQITAELNPAPEATVPEPMSLALLSAGLLGTLTRRRRV